MNTRNSLSMLASSIALALSLAACGGGGGSGGNVKDTPPPPPPAPKLCEDSTATNVGQPLPCTFRYNGSADNLLIPTNVDVAHEAGFTGQGVKIGVLDDHHAQADYAPLAGQIAWTKRYFAGEAPEGKTGHSTGVMTALAGKAVGNFKGGVAPDADVYLAEVCAEGCSSALIPQAINDMADQGVRLFNLSFGGGANSTGANDPNARMYANAIAPILARGGLVVSSAGNEGAENPGALPAAPLALPALFGRTMIATSAVLDSKGNVTGLAEYANKCGFAAEWCITAPATIEMPAIPGTDITWAMGGTSVAAPQVTGAAALVWQAFPWLDASGVQQTVLTTATDLGDPGVDAVYGWGLLNVGKAVRGPSQLIRGFNANVQSGEYTFHNDIGGTGSLYKTGGGTLTLAGNNTFTGIVDVSGGTLVAPKGLGGDAWVMNDATLFAGGTIVGNLFIDDNATAAVAIGNALTVGENASLGGTLLLHAPAAGYQVGETERVLTAAQIDGEFANVRYGNGFFWTAALDYTDTTLDAKLTSVNPESVAVAAQAAAPVIQGARNVGAVLDYTDNGNTFGVRADAVDSITAIRNTASMADAAVSFASLAGEVHGTARAVAIQQGMNDSRTIGDRLANLSPDHAGVWVQATALEGSFDRDGFADADYRQNAIAVGADVVISGNAIVGAMLASGRSWADLDALAGRFDAETTTAALYGRVEVAGSYLTANLAYSRSDVDTRRSLLIGSDMVSASASRDDSTLSARLEAGREFGSLVPFVAGGVVQHRQGGFTEAGGNGLAIAAGSDTATVHYGEAGLRFSHEIGNTTLRGAVAHRWTGGDTAPSFGASFTGADAVELAIAGQSLSSSASRATVGAEWRAGRSMFWNVDVAAERGSGQASNAAISGGLRIAF